MRLMRFSVAVSHGSGLELRTTLGGARGANAAADAGNNTVGMSERPQTKSYKLTGELRYKRFDSIIFQGDQDVRRKTSIQAAET